MDDVARHLLALTPKDEAQQAPGMIEFANTAGVPKSGRDHLIWTVEIDKDHTATIIMHKHDYKVLQDQRAADEPYKKF